MAKQTRMSKSRITYPEAQRVRARLLNSNQPTLNEQDRDTMLQILADIFPVRQRRPGSHQRRRSYQRQRHRTSQNPRR
jgi:hypothetical protein